MVARPVRAQPRSSPKQRWMDALSTSVTAQRLTRGESLWDGVCRSLVETSWRRRAHQSREAVKVVQILKTYIVFQSKACLFRTFPLRTNLEQSSNVGQYLMIQQLTQQMKRGIMSQQMSQQIHLCVGVRIGITFCSDCLCVRDSKSAIGG